MGFNPPLMFGPIAPESNPPINPQYFQPRVFNITALSLGATTTVTTNINHDYVEGQLIRLLISQPFGSFQLNERQGYVISMPASNQVVVSINSVNANPFVYNPTSSLSQPQIVAVGDVNAGAINASGAAHTSTFIPGSFQDISPA